MPSSLTFHDRPARGEASGLLVLHHGRGTDELDLLPLGDALDPDRHLHVVAPRGPLRLPGAPGFHWYHVPRVGYPDPETFRRACDALAEFHDEVWERSGLGPERTVLGGFSMGAVMSYALGLDPERPTPAGILAFSGFIPTVDGWEPQLAGRDSVRVLIAHGRRDPVIDVAFARSARELLKGAGFDVDYRESNTIHTIDPADIPRAATWLETVLSP
jgi:phospholipase/carboxylesterase